MDSVTDNMSLVDPGWGENGTSSNFSSNELSMLYNNASNGSGIGQLDPEIENMKIALEEMRFVVQIILVPMVIVIGVCGNIITIAVLTKRHMRSSTNFYLTALALSDMLYLLLFFSLSLQHHPGMHEPHTWFYWHYTPFAMWLVDASSATSTWLTVTFTIERYIAVCHPIRGKAICTPSRAKRVIIGVFLLCWGLTATTPHEWTVVTTPNNNGSYEMSLDLSPLGKNNTYRTIFFWFSAVVFTLLPLLLLSIFNSFLINTVNKSRVQRQTLSERPRNDKAKGSQSQEKKITLMLIAVVVLALICQTPAAIALLYSIFHKPLTGSRDDLAMRFLGNLFNLMTACNAALNFVLYCALSDKFRKTFMETFCTRCVEKPSPQHSYVHTTYTDISRRNSRASSVHYSNRSRRSSNSSSTSRLSPTPRHQPQQATAGQQQQKYLAVPPAATNHHPAGGEQNAPLLQK